MGNFWERQQGEDNRCIMAMEKLAEGFHKIRQE
jgi:hypothetical protein